MKRTLLLGVLLIGAVALRAELPESVVKACLAPVIYDCTSYQSWAVMSATQWDNSATQIAELETETISSQRGQPHPLNWAVTEVAIVQPLAGAERPETEQRLTLSVRGKGVLPKLELSLHFIDKAILPPCKVVTHQGKLALVSLQNDWYIIAEDPAMTITQTDEETPRTTLALPEVVIEKAGQIRASILVGEGLLP